MLANISDDVRKHYYDSRLHNLDWDALVRQAKLNISKAPDSAAADAEIAGLLEPLNDAHTSFIPIRKAFSVDYGWHFKVFGDRCYVTDVRPGSDAEAKGMKPGDQLLTIDGFAVDRTAAPKLHYALNVVIPRTHLDLVLRDISGKVLHLSVASEVQKERMMWGVDNGGRDAWQQRLEMEGKVDRARAQVKELGPELMILRIPYFLEDGMAVENQLRNAQAHKSLIIDLRGTPGGAIPSLLSYLENIFDREVVVGNQMERDKTVPLTIKGNHRNAFKGDLIVLVDSETASAGEVFARVVQMEQRGTILGDHTAGMVMESRIFPHVIAENQLYFYGASVSVAATVMRDGKSLEHVGVSPDRTMIPTPADLAAGRDPVLSYAAELVGVKVSPEEAAGFFPRAPLR